MPLSVRTKFYANQHKPQERSPCCQYEINARKCNTGVPRIRCPHGMLHLVRPLPNPNCFTTPTTLTNPWKLSYSTGRKCARVVKWCQECCINEIRDSRFAEMRTRESLPCRISFPTSDTPESIEPISPAIPVCSFSTESRTRAAQLQVGYHGSPTKSYLKQLVDNKKTTPGTNQCYNNVTRPGGDSEAITQESCMA